MRIVIGIALLGACAGATVVDRVAVVVGNEVITESEVLREIRITALLNGQPVNLGPDSRRAAAERLVDQALIRNEMNIGHYPEPESSEAEAMLANFRKTHFRSDAEYRAALRKYGVDEPDLKNHLLWELAALRFTDMRFRAGLPRATEPVRQHLEQHARARSHGEASRETAPSANGSVPESVDERLDAWLKEARSHTRIRFKKEAFQ